MADFYISQKRLDALKAAATGDSAKPYAEMYRLISNYLRSDYAFEQIREAEDNLLLRNEDPDNI